MQEEGQSHYGQQRQFIESSPQQLLFIALTGLGVGIALWLLTLILDSFVLSPLICRGGSTPDECAAVTGYAEAIAALFVSAGGLVGLVKFRVYRPLLIVVAAAIALWGIVSLASASHPVYLVAIITAFMYAVAYTTFAWINRIRLFWLAAAVLIVLVAIVRFILQ